MIVKHWLVESVGSPEFEACGVMMDVPLSLAELSDLGLRNLVT